MFGDNEFLLCSECFNDQGLKLDAERLGVEEQSECRHCHSYAGMKLTRIQLQNLTYTFFVLGTMTRTKYGAAPRLQFNFKNTSSIIPAPSFRLDTELLQQTIGARIFHYGPNLWMIGDIKPLKDLQNPSKRSEVITRIIKDYPTIILDQDQIFYRLRKGPKHPEDEGEYDSPPTQLHEFGRIDSKSLSVMYASQDIEICIHECRATAEDDLHIATLAATRPLKLLNLSHLLAESGVTPFESLELAVNMLFLAGKHSYEIIRGIASAALSAGFDGLSYPSYFSLLRTGGIPIETQFGLPNRLIANYLTHKSLAEHEISKLIPKLALFGRPIAQKIVSVKFINRLTLRRVSYDVYFGPVGYS